VRVENEEAAAPPPVAKDGLLDIPELLVECIIKPYLSFEDEIVTIYY
jgi:hypothetical protein